MPVSITTSEEEHPSPQEHRLDSYPPSAAETNPHDVAVAGNPDFVPGTVLGGAYRLTRRLAIGGMGEIHLATHERLPGEFVVKVLSRELVGDEDAFARFHQEAVAMASIRHPNVVQLVDFNLTTGGLPYLVMEYLPGRDLAEILLGRPILSPAEVCELVHQVARALDAAHKRGVVHRDLKPENIMVVHCDGEGDLIKLIDFGISKARRFNHVTAASMVLGTPEFMSPEQAEGRTEDIDAPADQFALAVISYLLLTGRTPWGTRAPREILHRVVNKAPFPVRPDDSWHSVEAVLFRGMSKRPSQRYPSTLAFWRALQRAMVNDGLIAALTGQSQLDLGQIEPPPQAPGTDASGEGAADAEEVPTKRQGEGRRPRHRSHAIQVTFLILLAAGAFAGLLELPRVRTVVTSAWRSTRQFSTLLARREKGTEAEGPTLISRLRSTLGSPSSGGTPH